VIFVAWQKVIQLRREAGAVGHALFEDAAGRLNRENLGVHFNAADAQTAYHAVSALAKKK
jgi:hypothetical protein